jgi:hypothetical protein
MLYARFFILAALPFCPTLFAMLNRIFFFSSACFHRAHRNAHLLPPALSKKQPHLSKNQLGASLLEFAA